MQGVRARSGRLTAEALGCLRGGRWVFRDLDFALAPGELLLLKGPNGSGKSSLLRLLAGLLRPASGKLAWEGEPIARDLAAHRARLAYLGHADGVKPDLSARENLRFWAGLAGLGRTAADGAAEAALAAFALAELSDLPLRFFSAGQRRRLALGRLLLAPRPLWLLDEPTVGLDEAAVRHLAQAVAAHRAAGGAAVLATHVAVPFPASASLDLAAFRSSDAAPEALFG